ncbi:MAG: hypothetical protein H5T69_02150 [Chloroflexi bacterium]|nr:hypothetical protein [Chloroflexota bacterium]
MTDGPLCPRCGRPRLIRRHEALEAPHLGELPLGAYLRWRLAGRGAQVLRHRYHCELCGHDWAVYEIRTTTAR